MEAPKRMTLTVLSGAPWPKRIRRDNRAFLICDAEPSRAGRSDRRGPASEAPGAQRDAGEVALRWERRPGTKPSSLAGDVSARDVSARDVSAGDVSARDVAVLGDASLWGPKTIHCEQRALYDQDPAVLAGVQRARQRRDRKPAGIGGANGSHRPARRRAPASTAPCTTKTPACSQGCDRSTASSGPSTGKALQCSRGACARGRRAREAAGSWAHGRVGRARVHHKGRCATQLEGASLRPASWSCFRGGGSRRSRRGRWGIT